MKNTSEKEATPSLSRFLFRAYIKHLFGFARNTPNLDDFRISEDDIPFVIAVTSLPTSQGFKLTVKPC